MHPQVSNTEIITPSESSINSVATTLKDHVLRDWDVADIKIGVKRVRQTEIGVVREVFVSPGLFDALCHYRFGKRVRRLTADDHQRIRELHAQGLNNEQIAAAMPEWADSTIYRHIKIVS